MASQIDDALSLYEAALDQVEQAHEPVPEAVLAVLVSRDQVQKVQQTSLSSTALITLSRYDERLRLWAKQGVSTFDFASWRALVNPEPQSWWWFLDEANQSLQPTTLTTYQQLVTRLEAVSQGDDAFPHQAATESLDTHSLAASVGAIAAPDSSDRQQLMRLILGLYLVRDGLDRQVKNTEFTAEQLALLSQLDERFRQQLNALSQQIDRRSLSQTLQQLDKVRKILRPSPDAWWWFSKVNVHWWDRLDSTWNALSLLGLGASLSLLVDTVPRFLSGGPSIIGGFVLVGQAFLAVVGGGVLTNTGKRLMEQSLERVNLPKHYWQEVRFLGVLLLLLLLIGLRVSLPSFARVYHAFGVRDYRNGELSSAEDHYQRALALYPSYTNARFNLGFLYEDLQNYDKARTEYALAARAGSVAAHNNLARLEIVAGNYREALNHLQRPQVQTYLNRPISDDPQVQETALELQYNLLKNTAWALQSLGFYEDAADLLQQAIELNTQLEEKKASAYCLYGQSLEALEQPQRALGAWRNCIDYSESLRNPEEFEWLYTARQRVQGDLEAPQ